MPSPFLIATLAAGLTGPAAPAADSRSEMASASSDCGAAASQVVEETGGELLSVQPTADGQCVVIVLIPGNGGRPKKVSVRVPM